VTLVVAGAGVAVVVVKGDEGWRWSGRGEVLLAAADGFW
jgi:hypothetical protein